MRFPLVRIAMRVIQQMKTAGQVTDSAKKTHGNAPARSMSLVTKPQLGNVMCERTRYLYSDGRGVVGTTPGLDVVRGFVLGSVSGVACEIGAATAGAIGGFNGPFWAVFLPPTI